MRLAKFGYWLSLLAVEGILIPTPISAAEIVAQAAPQATDVTLDVEGSLAGRVVASQGQAVPGARVALSALEAPRVYVVTDREGRFRIAGLRGGVYQLAVGERASAFRVWTVAAAPPGAQSSAVLVIDQSMVRGQNPFPDFVRSDAFLITTVVLAAIAIPIAIHNFRNDHPSGS